MLKQRKPNQKNKTTATYDYSIVYLTPKYNLTLFIHVQQSTEAHYYSSFIQLKLNDYYFTLLLVKVNHFCKKYSNPFLMNNNPPLSFSKTAKKVVSHGIVGHNL